MKIAFVNQLPDPESLIQFVNECSQEASGKEGTQDRCEGLLQHSDRVIAAYDGDRLVAVGGFTSGGVQDTEFSGEWLAAVRPDYKKRDLESNMKKIVGA